MPKSSAFASGLNDADQSVSGGCATMICHARYAAPTAAHRSGSDIAMATRPARERTRRVAAWTSGIVMAIRM